jgi:hypothetical protein
MFLKRFLVSALGLMGVLSAHPGHDHTAQDAGFVHLIFACGVLAVVLASARLLKKSRYGKGELS